MNITLILRDELTPFRFFWKKNDSRSENRVRLDYRHIDHIPLSRKNINYLESRDVMFLELGYVYKYKFINTK